MFDIAWGGGGGLNFSVTYTQARSQGGRGLPTHPSEINADIHNFNYT